jgi:ERCC4-type nuclease
MKSIIKLNMSKSNIKIIVDLRETKLVKLFRENENTYNFDVSYENLNIGDFHILYNDNNVYRIIHIYERKTLCDLLASIKDSRYAEQKSRLLDMDKSVKVSYIIEDYKSFTSIKDASLIGSICSLTLLNNFGMFYTKDVNDTYFLILEIMNRIAKSPSKFVSLERDSEEKSIIVTKKKSSSITKNNIIVNFLSQIPGISSKIASAIMLYHPTMSDLILKLNTFETSKERIEYLSKLKFSDNSRSIGFKTSEKIIEYLY